MTHQYVYGGMWRGGVHSRPWKVCAYGSGSDARQNKFDITTQVPQRYGIRCLILWHLQNQRFYKIRTHSGVAQAWAAAPDSNPDVHLHPPRPSTNNRN